MPDARWMVILDSNFVIAAESAADGDHANYEVASLLLRGLTDAGAVPALLENQMDDFARIPDPEFRARRSRQLQRYVRLPRIRPSSEFLVSAGYHSTVEPHSNDDVDASLLAYVERNGLAWLITEDRRILRAARRLSLQDQVFDLASAESALRSLQADSAAFAVDTIELVDPVQIDINAPFFDSFRDSYEDFNGWWRGKVVPQRRDTFVLPGEQEFRGLSVINPDSEHALGEACFKICALKVDERSQGQKFGESLIRQTLMAIRVRGGDSCFIEAKTTQLHLIGLLQGFGFRRGGEKEEGEDWFFKRLVPTKPADFELGALEFSQNFGPGVMKVERAFIVPIEPTYHDQLFPALSRQASLFQHSHGNAYSKVYICHSLSKQLCPGDSVFFYRSRDAQAVFVAGTVERVIRPANFDELVSFAGARSVYSTSQLESMLAKPVIAFRFRFDLDLDLPWNLELLKQMNVLTSHPQSITRVRNTRGVQWIRHAIGA